MTSSAASSSAPASRCSPAPPRSSSPSSSARSIGLVAGFFGRRLDNVLMRCMDVLLSFPSLLLAILIVTVLGRGLINSVLAIAIVSVPAYARVVRGQVLSVREQDFITADRALGVRSGRLLTHRVFPNTLTPLIVQATLGFATAVLGDRRPRLPRPRRAAARRRVGHDDLGGLPQHLQLAAPRVLPRADDLHQRAGVQPPRRRPARRPRSAERAGDERRSADAVPRNATPAIDARTAPRAGGRDHRHGQRGAAGDRAAAARGPRPAHVVPHPGRRGPRRRRRRPHRAPAARCSASSASRAAARASRCCR